jgi:putative transcriptional regulator
MSQIMNLVPGILIAMPKLVDPNFRRTVVVVLQHDDEGTVGLVLNRPTSHRCSAVAESLDISWELGEGRFISVGGPVEPQSLWMVHSNALRFNETIEIGSKLAVSRSEQALRHICEAGEHRVKMFVGYAGWGPGQLEQEIREGAWLTTELTDRLMFDIAEPEIWGVALQELGIDPLHLATPTDTLH